MWWPAAHRTGRDQPPAPEKPGAAQVRSAWRLEPPQKGRWALTPKRLHGGCVCGAQTAHARRKRRQNERPRRALSERAGVCYRIVRYIPKSRLASHGAWAFLRLSDVSHLPSNVVTVFTLVKNTQEYLFLHGPARLCGHFQTEGREIAFPSRLPFGSRITTWVEHLCVCQTLLCFLFLEMSRLFFFSVKFFCVCVFLIGIFSKDIKTIPVICIANFFPQLWLRFCQGEIFR